ncbi:FAD binding domain-containing protein [Ilyonectria robusta]
MSSKNFTVLIAGGSIAGLTLANMLELVGIDYIILEAYPEIAPQVGASIGLVPNGCRVLDQIGVYDQIRDLIKEPLFQMSLRNSDGNATSQYDGIGDQFRNRYGYDVIVVDRQMVLEALWNNLKKKDKVLVNKRVTQVHLEPSGVKVETSDGESFSGDILVGADGTHSQVRSEMWRLADDMEPGYIPASEHTECLPTIYKCIFGISVMEAWQASAVQTNLNKHFSYLIIAGPKHRVYWFLFVNMGKTHYGPELPRFTKEDEEALVNEHRGDKITESYTFGDLYSAKISSVLTPLPEYVFKKWHFNRIMTIGDAAHKLEPIAGQGGNSAIETAAVLVTNLTRMLNAHPSGVTLADIDGVFGLTQKTREPRVLQLVGASHMEQRFSALESPVLEFVGRYLLPMTSIEEKQDPWSTNFEGAHKLDILDVPKRSHFNPFFDELPIPPLPPSMLPKLAMGVVLCGLLYIAKHALVISPDPGPSTFLSHELKKTFTGVTQVDAMLSFLVWAFSEATSGSNLNKRVQALYFLVNLIPIIYIWTVEGYRNGNRRSPLVSWPSAFTVYQLVGIGKVAPVYFAISLFTTSRAVYTRPTGRPIPSSVAHALLPALCLGYVLPTALMFIQYEDSVVQQNAIAFWQPSPVYVSVLTWTFSRFFQHISPAKSLDWEMYEKRDLAPLEAGYALSFFATAITHICTMVYVRYSPSVSISQAFFNLPTVASMGINNDIDGFWKYDLLLCFGTVAMWCLYSVYELRRLGYVTTQKAISAGMAIFAGEILVGPGATYAGLWAWREKVIAGLVKGQ